METSKSDDIKPKKKSVTLVQQTLISKTKLIQELSKEVNKRATERMLKDLILGK